MRACSGDSVCRRRDVLIVPTLPTAPTPSAFGLWALLLSTVSAGVGFVAPTVEALLIVSLFALPLAPVGTVGGASLTGYGGGVRPAGSMPGGPAGAPPSTIFTLRVWVVR